MIAGFKKKDTRLAGRVLADYGNFNLTGQEVEISGISPNVTITRNFYKWLYSILSTNIGLFHLSVTTNI